jgi:2-keto-4-pentenoate hydratase/2-oxohepta-3-ene-1,7-dioic acid hydratase in catechol pathway
MKLATFTLDGEKRIGRVEDDVIVDLSAVDVPTEMTALLEAGESALTKVRTCAGKIHQLSKVQLCAPIHRPPKILAVGLNYKDHIEETGLATPEFPMFFNKQATAANGPYSHIHLPKVSNKLDYEGELGFIIGRRCRHVTKENAHSVIAGYVVCNDVSVRDWQMRSQTFTLGKSFDTHSPFGPWITTKDEVEDPHALDIKTWVDGELRQDSNTRHLVFDCFDQIATLTAAFTLEVGDLILTGTPSGVGIGFDPKRFLTVGQKVKVEISGLGSIENEVISEPESTAIG